MIRALGLAFLLGGCSAAAGGGDPASCAGDYLGTYDGDDVGVVAGVLSDDGVLEVLFTSDAGEVDAAALVTDDGDVTGEEGGTTVEGRFDFGDCSARGEWTTDGTFTGSWQIERS
jgi:hypothetical protein